MQLCFFQVKHVLDYLLKPISFPRFIKATNKILARLKELKGGQDFATDFVFVKTDKKVVKVDYADILFVEAMQNYIVLHTVKGKLLTGLTQKFHKSPLLKGVREI